MPMTSRLLFFILSLVVLSILMVLVMVPFSSALVFGAVDAPGRHARARLRKGPFLAERLLPPAMRTWPPVVLWGTLYGIVWAAILGLSLWMVIGEGGPSMVHNLLVLVIVFGGFWATQTAIILFARAIVRASTRAGAAERVVGAGAAELESERIPNGGEEPGRERARPAGRFRAALRGVVNVMVVLAAVAIGEAVPVSKSLETYLVLHRTPFLAATLALAAAGFVLFMGGIIHLVLVGGRPMSHGEIEAAIREQRDRGARPSVWRRSTYRVRGATVGLEGRDEFSVRDLKLAWRARAWRVDPVWRRRFAVTLGASMLAVGVFGVVFVLAPAGLKLVVAAAVLYALGRTAQGLRRA